MTKKRKKNQKEYRTFLFSSVILCLLSVGLSYIIFKSDYLKPKLNEMTMSYISFNNKDTTDMLKIKNITKMSDAKGKSSHNNHKIEFELSGEKEMEYKVILYPITNNIEEQYIKFYFQSKKNKIEDSLEALPTTQDGGKILYEGKMDEQKIIVRLWISKEYTKRVKENSFEIKIKPR